MKRSSVLGLCALLAVSICTELFAGQFEACEASKKLFQELGVYGLCNAWHNADTDEERRAFADKFEDKAGFEPPWIAGPVCPCFSMDALAYAGTQVPAACTNQGGLKNAKYNPGVLNLEYYTTTTFCMFRNATGAGPAGVPPMLGLTEEQAKACLDAVFGLIQLDFTNNGIGCG